MSVMRLSDEERRKELAAVRPFRVGLYSYLSRSFKSPPSSDVLESLKKGELLDSIAEVFGEEFVTDLRETIRGATNVGELAREIDQEFLNLFKIPGGQYVTPYESVFRDTREIAGKQVKGLLQGQSALDVRQWYRLARLEICADYDDLPDHIVLELRYMADICAKEQELEEAGDLKRLERAWEMQRDFLAGHLARWVPDLAGKMLEKTRHPYFRTLAHLTSELVQRDLLTLEELIGPSARCSVPDYAPVQN